MKYDQAQGGNREMEFLEIPELSIEEKSVVKEIEELREYYNQIELHKYFEPQMIWQTDNTKKTDKMTLLISDTSNINQWIQGVSQGCIVKMRYIEEALISLITLRDLYSSAILIRHHMELSGLICLSLEVLLEDNKDKLQRFISKTSYGAAFYNNPKLRDSDFALFRTETPTVTAMIGALDNFVQANSYSEEKDIYKHNYAFLCQFSHPSQDSSALFVDAIEENEGHVMQFRWVPDFGDTGIIKYT